MEQKIHPVAGRDLASDSMGGNTADKDAKKTIKETKLTEIERFSILLPSLAEQGLSGTQ